jgi:putative ABC transport system permease protein
MRPPPPRLLRSALALLLRLYPRPFRERFAGEMVAAFDDAWSAAGRGAAPRLGLAVRTFADLGRSAVAERLRPGLPDPPPVRRTAGQTQQESTAMDDLRQDLKHALRSLRKRPGFTLVAALTLALGIGATTAIFSVVHGILLRPLPYPRPDELVTVDRIRPDGRRGSVSQPDLRDMQAELGSFTALAGFSPTSLTLTGLGEAKLVPGARVTDGLLAVFAQAPTLGRDLRQEENLPDGPQVTLIGHRFWQQRLGGAPDAVGRTLELSGTPYEIVGVAPPGFDYPDGAQLWIPMYLDTEDCGRGCNLLQVAARLAPATPLATARQELAALATRLEAAYPEDNYRKTFVAETLEETEVGAVRRALWMLLAGVGMVLLVACANVGNLLLARAAGRRGEMEVRAALGAGRGRLLRLLGAEAALLAAGGGAAGILFAWEGVDLLVRFAPATLPRVGEVRLDGAALLFAGGLMVATALLFGLAPALQLSRVAGGGGLRSGSGGAGEGRAGFSRGALLVAEVALSLMLLTGAGLLARSFVRLTGIELGFDEKDVLRFSLSLPDARYPSPGDAVRYFSSLEEGLRSLPGVRAVGSIFGSPLGKNRVNGSIYLLDRPPAPPGQEDVVATEVVTPGLFATLGLPLLRGRGFEPGDLDGAARVAVVSQSLAERFYPGLDPIGRPLRTGVSFGYEEEEPRRIVGVVGDLRSRSLTAEPEPTLYLPQGQVGSTYLAVLVRTEPGLAGIEPMVRAEVRRADPGLALRGVETLESAVGRSLAPARFYTCLLAAFALVALALAAVGLYGVVAYLVSRRHHEIAVRMALGADGPRVVGLVLGQGLRPAAVGVALGLAGAALASRLLASLLYGVEPTDPATFAAVTALVAAVLLLALALPAARASRIRPMAALKDD